MGVTVNMDIWNVLCLHAALYANLKMKNKILPRPYFQNKRMKI